jgi:hypothetical protein
LDTVEPSPTVLLSAEEAKARLRKICFRRRPSDRKRRILTRKWAGENQGLLISRREALGNFTGCDVGGG